MPSALCNCLPQSHLFEPSASPVRHSLCSLTRGGFSLAPSFTSATCSLPSFETNATILNVPCLEGKFACATFLTEIACCPSDFFFSTLIPLSNFAHPNRSFNSPLPVFPSPFFCLCPACARPNYPKAHGLFIPERKPYALVRRNFRYKPVMPSLALHDRSKDHSSLHVFSFERLLERKRDVAHARHNIFARNFRF